MLANTDWAGIASVIAAVGSSAAAVIAAIATTRVEHVRRAVKTSNGHTIGAAVENVETAVATRGSSTLAQTVETVADAVSGKTGPDTTPTP